MRWRRLLLSIFLLLTVVVSSPRNAVAVGSAWVNIVSESKDPHALKILLVGNSKFYWHDMPKMFSYLFKAGNPNQPLKLTEVAGDAFTLEEHWNDGTARRIIRDQGPWDYVVLLERTGRPESQEESPLFDQSLTQFERDITAAKARLVLIETYNDDEDRADDHLTHESMVEAAKKHHAYLLPIGQAWSSVRLSHPDIDLYDEDNHHPNLKGTYLMACLSYSFFTRRAPENLPTTLNYDDIRAKTRSVTTHVGEAHVLQSTAWTFISPIFSAAGRKGGY